GDVAMQNATPGDQDRRHHCRGNQDTHRVEQWALEVNRDVEHHGHPQTGYSRYDSARSKPSPSVAMQTGPPKAKFLRELERSQDGVQGGADDVEDDGDG